MRKQGVYILISGQIIQTVQKKKRKNVQMMQI